MAQAPLATIPPASTTGADATAGAGAGTGAGASDVADPLKPGMFRSLLPFLEDILAILHEQADGQAENGEIGVGAGIEEVVRKAKELAAALGEMKAASLGLPGGHLSTEEVRRLTNKFEEEAEKRRRILDAFDGRSMSQTDSLAQSVLVDGEGLDAYVESVLSSPARGNGT